MVINGSCSTNMCAWQLSFNFSSMVGGGGMAPWTPFGSAPGRISSIRVCVCRLCMFIGVINDDNKANMHGYGRL